MCLAIFPVHWPVSEDGNSQTKRALSPEEPGVGAQGRTVELGPWTPKQRAVASQGIFRAISSFPPAANQLPSSLLPSTVPSLRLPNGLGCPRPRGRAQPMGRPVREGVGQKGLRRGSRSSRSAYKVTLD